MTKHNGSIEQVRVWAALGIVCFHAQSGLPSIIGYAGLPAFAILSAFLLGDVRSAQGPRAVPLARFTERRARRLLVPWAAWLAFYLVVDASVVAIGLRPRDWLDFNPLFGTRIHLWYLPFVFFGLVGIRLAAPALARLGRRGVIAVAAAAGVVAAVVVPGLPWITQLPLPAPQFLFAAPALGYGVALAQIATIDDRSTRQLAASGVGGLAIAAAVAAQVAHGDSWIPYGLAVPATFAAALAPTEVGPVARTLAPLTLGVYLVHPFVVGVIRTSGVMARLGLPDETTFVWAFGVSLGAVALLRRTPLRFAT